MNITLSMNEEIVKRAGEKVRTTGKSRAPGAPDPDFETWEGEPAAQAVQPSAVVGSIIVITCATLLAGNPPCAACSRTSSSLGAM